ncbi:MAG TPA: protein translocase subunit SecF [Anaerolineales bacterium]|nr:protein translocase subunit SecF [Anaerolineales bacterium]
MLNILEKRNLFFAISLLAIVPGLILAVARGLPLSIDFTGGSLLEVQFASGKSPSPAEVISLYERFGVSDVQVQTTGEDVIIARSSFLDDTTRGQIETAMEQEFSDKVTVRRFNSVGPTIGREVTLRAALAVLVAAIVVVIYITYAFRGVPHAILYGICAIIAMLHDVAVVLSLAAIGGRFFDWQIDALFLTALLTVIGFSVQDKIVVFDRIRENRTIFRRLPFETLVNHSIIQTLQRSINTQLMTVEFMLLALALFGGVTLREFAVILLVGLFSGTYSSIFIAAPILVAWENQISGTSGPGTRQATT